MLKNKSLSTKLIMLCWLAYSCSYIGKLSYNANIISIGSAFSATNAECGMVSSFFFFVYGAGQIFNGIFCKKYNIKYVIFGALAVSAFMNLLIPVLPSFEMIKYVWLINGASMSFLWTSLIRLLSETLPTAEISKATVAMGTTVATGTFIVYGISAVFVAILSYHYTFITAGVVMLAVAVVWLLSYDSLVKPLTEERALSLSSSSNKSKSSFDIQGSLPVFVGIIAFFAVANNFVKDGITAWTPKILSFLYRTPDWLSILLTLLLALMAIFGSIVAVRLQQKTKNFVLSCVLLFLLGAALIATVILLIKTPLLPVTISCFAIVSCLMAGVNNVITSMIPLALKERVGSGSLAGILNGFCYLGSTISTYGLGLISDVYDWYTVFYVLLGICLGVSVLGAAYLIYLRMGLKPLPPRQRK